MLDPFRWLYSVSCRPGVFLAVHKLDTCLINDLTNIQSFFLIHFFFLQLLKENYLFQTWQKYALKYKQMQHFLILFLIKTAAQLKTFKIKIQFHCRMEKNELQLCFYGVLRQMCL